MDSIYYNKTPCERCYNKECSHQGKRNIHIDDKNNICNSFINENKQKNTQEELYEFDLTDYSPFGGMW